MFTSFRVAPFLVSGVTGRKLDSGRISPFVLCLAYCGTKPSSHVRFTIFIITFIILPGPMWREKIKAGPLVAAKDPVRLQLNITNNGAPITHLCMRVHVCVRACTCRSVCVGACTCM